MNAPRPEVPEGLESFGRQLTRIEERVAAVHEHGATKADIQVLDGKIGALDETFDGKIGALEEKLDGKIGALDEKFEVRIAHLEENGATKADIVVLDGKISVLDARVASIGKHGATKADIRALEARIGWWILGVIVLIVVGLVLEIVRP